MAQDKRKRVPAQGAQKVMSKDAQDAAKGLQLRPQVGGGKTDEEAMQPRQPAGQGNPVFAALRMGANGMPGMMPGLGNQPGRGRVRRECVCPVCPDSSRRQPWEAGWRIRGCS